MTSSFQSLDKSFDAVVMLTWSDWRTEPRSNRYHYATRLARRWPVIFVQATHPAPGADMIEKVDGHDILLVHAGDKYDAAQSEALKRLLMERGVRRPLYWIYNPRFTSHIERCPGQLHVLHATEDYLGKHDDIPLSDAEIVEQLRRLLTQTDLVVAVTEAVAEGVRVGGRYRGSLVVVRNGCDVDHWRQLKVAAPTAKIAFYQGGINQRLDFSLLIELADRLPGWTFWLCGDASVAPQPQWSELCARPNVKWHGSVNPDELATLQAQATVGIIPFRQISLIRASLPLKAYEYIASGLPVVTVPIDELSREPDMFQFAETTEDFARGVEAAVSKRKDAAWLARAEVSAAGASYDSRFATVLEKLAIMVEARKRSNPKRNVLVLYDNASTYVGTIREHLESLSRYSEHHVYYMPAAGASPPGADDVDLSMFDVVVLHYSVRLSIPNHLMETIARPLERFSGMKIAFLQDEYETVDTARAWLKRLKFDVLFTCVPISDAHLVYPKADFPWMRLVPTLTGYVPDDAELEIYQRPMRERKIVIGYRGRRLSHFYGDLGQEKLRIGIAVRKEAETRSIPVDIEVDEEHRIYGAGWYEFLAGARATLGTESGSNVFDFDGSLKRSSAEHNQLPYEEFRRLYLVGREGPIRMNQISPKVFEAIRMRVALVLFEGEYSGVVKPDLHYIPLKKDLSNIDEVFTKLENLAFLEALTERAYRDVLESGRYSYRTFVKHVDAEIMNGTGMKCSRSALISIPAFVVRRNEFTNFPASTASVPTDALLPDGLSRENLLKLLRPTDKPAAVTIAVEQGRPAETPQLSRLSSLRERLQKNSSARSALRGLERLWIWTPSGLKAVVRKVIR